jgi:hypothetical protein
MQITRTIAVLGLFTAGIVAACSDSGPVQPDAPKALLGSTGTSAKDTAGGHTPPDTSHHTPPDSGGSHTPPDTSHHTVPDTVGQIKPSNDPRTISGNIHGLGAQPDTTQYDEVAGATIVISTMVDTAAHTTGQELGRAVSKSDGSYTLGAFKPGIYTLTVTPPAGSPFAPKQWPLLITQTAPPIVWVTVYLNRK